MLANKSVLNDFKVWINPKNLSLFNKSEIISKFWHSRRRMASPPELIVQEALSRNLDSSTHSMGVFALRIFFFQIFSKDEFCIDLRPKQFKYKTRWHFVGENLIYKFNPSFIQALRKTYECFYLSEGKNLEEHLICLGVISPEWEAKDKLKVVNLFTAHFNSADRNDQDFTLEKLVNSFTQIFSFLRSKNHIIHTDFAFLGLYLTSLYMVLEKSDKPIKVNQCFHQALELINS